MSPEVLLSEVGPRDGMQSVAATMPTAAKLRWIDALHGLPKSFAHEASHD